MQQVSRKLDPVCLDQTKFKNSNKKYLSENKPSNSKKKSNFHKSDRLIFGLIREDSPCEPRKLIYKISNDSSVGKINIGRRKKNDSSFNRGRWHAEEHQRFIEGLLEYGNDWKNVQKFVGSRSSTQARSHAQKFFVKIGKTQIENLNLDFENNSLKSLNIMASKLNSDQLSRAIKNLNELVFDRKNSGRKNAKFEKNQKFEISEDTEFEKSLQIKNLSEIVQNFSSFSQAGLFPEKKKNQCQSSSFDNPIKFTLIKKKRRLRKIKKSKTSKICYQLQSITPIHLDQEIEIDQIDLNNSFRFYRSGIHQYKSNIKNSFDPGANYNNFISDNSIFISNSSLRNFVINPYDLEVKDFQLIFENTFQFCDFCKENKSTPENGDDEILCFVQEKSPEKAGSIQKKFFAGNENAGKENVTDIFEQFINC